MSRKRDPIFSVMDFFEGASLDVAQSTFSLVKRIVQKRLAAEAPPVVKRHRAKRTTASSLPPVNQAIPLGVHPTPAAPPPGPPPPAQSAMVKRRQARRRRASAIAMPGTPTGATEQGLDLPGLGPSTVGDE
jgi:hypothetical protein